MLLDISKSKSKEFLDGMEALLHERRIETFRISKPTFARPAPVDVIEEGGRGSRPPLYCYRAAIGWAETRRFCSCEKSETGFQSLL